MKRLLVLLPVLLLSLATACKPHYGYYISARFDARKWSSLPEDPDTELIAELDEYELYVDYFSYEDDYIEQFGFIVAARPGPHFLTEYGENEGYVYFGSNRDWEEYDTEDEGCFGIVWITRITDTYVQGRFWFKAGDFEGNYVQVRNGRFRVEIEEY